LRRDPGLRRTGPGWFSTRYAGPSRGPKLIWPMGATTPDKLKCRCKGAATAHEDR
jgi:hypothetical protein